MDSVGLATAEALARVCGGETILVPMGQTATRAEKRYTIARLLKEGLSAPEIARRLSVHEATVRRVARRLARS